MALAAGVCVLAIIQAGSIYTGERAQYDLRFWGICMGSALLGALGFVILAIRVGRSRGN